MMNGRPASSDKDAATASAPFVGEARLLAAVEQYLRPEDIEHVQRVLAYARELREQMAQSGRALPDVDYVIGVALTLAEFIHIDAVSLAAVLLYQAVESGVVALDAVREWLGGAFGETVAQTIANIERFDSLQRPGAALRRSALAGAESDDGARERRRGRERQRQQDAESLRKMFIAMAEDPRVAVFKIADQLRLMRLAFEAAAPQRAALSEASAAGQDGDGEAASAALPSEESRLLAEETRSIYAPLAGRLGMGRVEGELDDLAFAILQPEDYTWLSEAVKGYVAERESYVRRVCEIVEREMREIGLHADVSGRVKHLYSIFKKVQRTGSRDLSSLYDVLAFRIIVPTVEDCYLALGHVHALWKPKDGRIKDFIANPKPNGYQSLHTTVFCLDDRLAEFQIRTPQMHELAEYGVAMHWYYKDVGDSATAEADALKGWVQQLKEWQQELSGRAATERSLDAVKGEVLRDQIFVFTPAGDVKELVPGSTPLDFAYLIHTDVGNHVSGARVSSQDASGRLVKKLVPLDYELKSGDVVEIIKRKDAHPTRDWLHIAHNKTTRDRIQRYLKAHERDIDSQMGHERLDRELRALGLRKGYDDLSDEDVEWLVAEFEQRDAESLLVAIGAEKLRLSAVVARLRERLAPAQAAEPEPQEMTTPTSTRELAVDASVAGLEGMLTRLAACCDPLPGDELTGYITRGRGVVVHRADCPNLRHLLAQEPERAIPVSLSKLAPQQNFRAPIVIEAHDRTGLLADVTGTVTGMKLNMLKVNTATNPRQHRATITVTLEIQRPEQLMAVIKQLQQVPSVLTVERKKAQQKEAAAGSGGRGRADGRRRG
jgi:GTP pyrophosphokinase